MSERDLGGCAVDTTMFGRKRRTSKRPSGYSARTGQYSSAVAPKDSFSPCASSKATSWPNRPGGRRTVSSLHANLGLRLFLGALTRGSMLIAGSGQPKATRDAVARAVRALLQGLSA